MERRDFLAITPALLASGAAIAGPTTEIDLLIRGGKIVLSEGVFRADLLVNEGKVTGIGNFAESAPQAQTIIDAQGKYVLPGLLDSHVHFNTPFLATSTRDNFYSGSISAAYGGVTTYIDFAFQPKGADLIKTIENRRAEADANTVVDYSLHVMITDPSARTLAQLGELLDSGLPSVKVFMAFGREGLKVNDGAILDIMRIVADHNGIIAVHTENNAIAEWIGDRYREDDKTAASYYPETRPRYIEHEAIRRALFYAELTGVRYYGFHLSIADGVEEFRRARSANLSVHTETCTHYLVLNEDVYAGPNGANFVCSPPIRTSADNKALWQGINDRVISTVTADHTAWDLTQKRAGGGSYIGIPHGLPGVEMRLPVLYTKGVLEHRITLERLVELLSTSLAKVWGLYPQKGTLAPGADADFVIFDPNVEWTVRPDDLHMEVDWSPYTDWKLSGRVQSVFSRGKSVIEERKFKGTRGSGRFLVRTLS